MSLRLLSTEYGSSGILFIGFNQDYGCFAVGLQNGFRIYNTDPLKQLEKCEFNVREGTGVGFVEMLFRTSFLGVLGGGNQARLPGNTACLWDGVEQKFVLELSYGSDVRAVRLRRDRIAVVLLTSVKVYTFGATPELVFQSESAPNPLGLCHFCQVPDFPLIAFPGKHIGSVTLATTASNEKVTTSPPPRQILAHENPLVALTMSANGELLATASQRGTLVRVFSTKGCELLHELRRGSNAALISCICFDAAANRLAVLSNHGTVHVFCFPASSTAASRGQDATRHVAQSNKVNAPLLRYFSATCSQIKCTLDTQCKSICAFSTSTPDTLVILSADGSFSKYSFTPNGIVTKVQSVNFIDFYDDDSDL